MPLAEIDIHEYQIDGTSVLEQPDGPLAAAGDDHPVPVFFEGLLLP